jgi:hypothetical protein
MKIGKSEKRWLVAAIVEFLLAGWFLFLVRYLYNSAVNTPSANTSGEGDIVSAFLMLILFAAAAFFAFAFLICLLVFTVKIFKNRKT